MNSSQPAWTSRSTSSDAKIRYATRRAAAALVSRVAHSVPDTVISATDSPAATAAGRAAGASVVIVEVR